MNEKTANKKALTCVCKKKDFYSQKNSNHL